MIHGIELIARGLDLDDTQSDDCIELAATAAGTPAAFRGSVLAGAGDDDVNLGTLGGQANDWFEGGEFWGTNPQGLGAFVDGGEGDDRIVGTDGNDLLLDGAGDDFLDGGNGEDSYRARFDGSSADVIHDSGDPGDSAWLGAAYGGRFPLDELILPEGATLDTLRWRSVADPAYGAEAGLQAIEIHHGQARLLVVYADPANPAETEAAVGVERIRFADGTVLSRAEFMAAVPQLPDNAAPIVVGVDLELAAGQGLALGEVFTASDAEGDALARYEVRVRGGDGSLSLAGLPQDAAQTLNLGSDEWATLSYVAGNEAAAGTIEVRAFDGIDWSEWAAAHVTPAPVVNQAPQVSGSDQTVAAYQMAPVAAMFGAVDAEGDQMTHYEVSSSGGDAGFLLYDGDHLAAGEPFLLETAELAYLDYVGGLPGESATISLRAFDGNGWSEWASWQVDTAAAEIIDGTAGDDSLSAACKAARGKAGSEPVISISYFVAALAICSSALNNPN